MYSTKQPDFEHKSLKKSLLEASPSEELVQTNLLEFDGPRKVLTTMLPIIRGRAR